jgi:hypothetical protein
VGCPLPWTPVSTKPSCTDRRIPTVFRRQHTFPSICFGSEKSDLCCKTSVPFVQPTHCFVEISVVVSLASRKRSYIHTYRQTWTAHSLVLVPVTVHQLVNTTKIQETNECSGLSVLFRAHLNKNPSEPLLGRLLINGTGRWISKGPGTSDRL